VSNFVGIKHGRFVTPSSASVLPSITNVMLQQLAKDMAIPVEVRPVDIAELKDFDEVGGCGTAVVLAWVKAISFGYDGESLEYPKLNLLAKLKERLEAIQRGDFADCHNWMRPVRVFKDDTPTSATLQLPLK
jgi:branched-chain amino acid aminotransferase